jgi:Uma2 family endonuclease
MAIEILNRNPWHVTTYVPNERETQTLGGSQTHASAALNLFQTLRTYAARLGVLWLVRFEAELRYPRANGTTGTFYPDVFMAPDVEIDNERPYVLSEVGRPPALVVEIASDKTVRRDVGPKRQAYAEMGVEEYVTFDPRDGMHLALRGYRLVSQGHYRDIPAAPEGGLWLNTVGLRVQAEEPIRALDGPLLRLTTRAGERLLHSDEEAEARETAEEGWDAERQAREAAEQAREAAEERWDAERQSREAAERANRAAQAEIARLRALLGDSAP